MLRKLSIRYGIEIPDFSMIGSGLNLSHAFNITVNSKSVIGNDCVLFKGCTIGSIRGGAKSGIPTIGDRVVICANSTVVGNITIGDDVLIAANSFVNFSVPANSIVIGNPAVIKHSDKPTREYVPLTAYERG